MGTLLLIFVVFNVAVWAGKPLENDIAGSPVASQVATALNLGLNLGSP